MIIEPTTNLYRGPAEALAAAFAAAGATCCGTASPHPSNREMAGRTGYGWWTGDHSKVEQIAEGLRLTGYTVVLLRGFSTGIVIIDEGSGHV